MRSSTRGLVEPTCHERRVARRLAARGDDGLAEALLRLKGKHAGGRYRLEQLYAVGAEGAVFDVADELDPAGEPLVAKVALLPVHRPFELDPDDIRRRRYALRVESQYLLGNSSPFMPRGIGLFELANPLLDDARGDAFAEPEPILVMEKLPGRDLDRWLARMHRSGIETPTMRRTLDRVAVVLLQALTDLRRRGVYYADLRPGNMRMMGRPSRRVRMLDAGSLVSVHDRSGRFPHVPAYLPPEMFRAARASERIVPSDAAQAVMAGRTLYEVATGSVPRPGEPVDLSLLPGSNVSQPVAEVVAGLCSGECSDVRVALRHLYSSAKRRVPGGNDPRATEQEDEPLDAQDDVHADTDDGAESGAPAEDTRHAAPRGAATEGDPMQIVARQVSEHLAQQAARREQVTSHAALPATDDESVLPPGPARPSLLRRLFGKLVGR